jgi:hypothetical protein
MSETPSVGIDVGSLGCRFAVLHDGAPVPLWAPPIFHDSVADRPPHKADAVGKALHWKETLGVPAAGDPMSGFAASLARRMLAQGVAAADEHWHAKTQRAVLVVPATYSSRQRQVLFQCAAEAGLSEIFFASDCVALAAAHAERQPSGHVLVFHCGYVGWEIAVVSALQRHIRVLSLRDGDVPSGRSVDQRLLEVALAPVFAPGRQRELGISSAGTLRIALAQLRGRLHRDNQAVVQFHFANGRQVESRIDRAGWREQLRTLVAPCIGAADVALAEARLRQRDLTQVVLAGGSTAWPEFAEMFHRHLQTPVVRLHAWSAAFGAALLAARMANATSAGILQESLSGTVTRTSATSQTAKEVVIFLAAEPPPATEAPSPGHSAADQLEMPSAGSLSRRLALRALQRAEKLLADNRLQEAVSSSHQAYQDDGDSPQVLAAMLDIHCRAAHAHNTVDGYPKALEWLQCANGHDPGNIDIRKAIADRHLLHARQLLQLGRESDAADAAGRAFQMRPELADSESLLAELCSKTLRSL